MNRNTYHMDRNKNIFDILSIDTDETNHSDSESHDNEWTQVVTKKKNSSSSYEPPRRLRHISNHAIDNNDEDDNYSNTSGSMSHGSSKRRSFSAKYPETEIVHAKPCDSGTRKYYGYRNKREDRINDNNYYNRNLDNDHKDEDLRRTNHKKILCNSMLFTGSCTYGNKCVFAHSLDEQNYDTIRKRTMSVFESGEDLSMFSPIFDKDLYRDLSLMTRVCMNCKEGKCTGGKNCKHGSRDETQLLCEDDFKYGSCEDENCKKIHLTKRGLKPYHSNINTSQPNKNYIKSMNQYVGQLITEDTLKTLTIMKDKYIEEDNDSFEIFSNSSDEDDECYRSIFEDKIDKLFGR